MNKEMVEIMELRDELNEFKKATKDNLEKMSKKVKDNKADNKKLIQEKFEEIMESYSYSLKNNPKVAMNESGLKEEIRKFIEEEIGNGNSSEGIKLTIKKQIEELSKDNQKDITELTALVGEIADRVVDENKKLKDRLLKLEQVDSNSEIELAIADTNKIVKMLENEINSVENKNKEKINSLRENQENNELKLENLESLVNELKNNGGKSGMNDKEIEELLGIQQMQQATIKELQNYVKKQDEKIDDYLNGKNDSNFKDKVKEQFDEINDFQENILKQIRIISNKEEELEEKEDVIENHGEKIDTIIALLQEQEKQIDRYDDKFYKLEEKIENKNNVKINKAELLEDLEKKYDIKISNFEDRLNISERFQNDIEEHYENFKEINQGNVARFEEIEKNIAELKEDTSLKQDVENQIEKIKKVQEEEKKQLNEEIGNQIEEIKKEQEEQNDYLNKVIGKYNEKHQNYAISLNFLNTNIEKYKDESAKSLEEIHNEISGLNIEELKENVSNLQNDANEFQNSINYLENNISDIQSNANDIQNSVNYLEKNLVVLQNSINNFQNDESIAIIEEKTNEIEKAQKDIFGKIGLINLKTEKIETLESGLNELQEKVIAEEEKNNISIKEIEEKISEQLIFGDKVENVELQLENIENNIDSGRQQLENLRKQQINLENTLEEIQQRTDLLEENKFDNEKFENMEKAQEQTARKVKNLAIAMEERLEVFEQALSEKVNGAMEKTEILNKVNELEDSVSTIDSQIQEQFSTYKEEFVDKLNEMLDKNYSNLATESAKEIDKKIGEMQNKSNKVFSKKLEDMHLQNEQANKEQIEKIKTQANEVLNKELLRLKNDTKKSINDSLTKIQLQNEEKLQKQIKMMQIQTSSIIDKKIKLVQADYDVKINKLEKMISDLAKNNDNSNRVKMTRNNVATQVFSYDSEDDYKSLFSNVNKNKLKEAADNIEGIDFGDSNIINFFDEN